MGEALAQCAQRRISCMKGAIQIKLLFTDWFLVEANIVGDVLRARSRWAQLAQAGDTHHTQAR